VSKFGKDLYSVVLHIGYVVVDGTVSIAVGLSLLILVCKCLIVTFFISLLILDILHNRMAIPSLSTFQFSTTTTIDIMYPILSYISTHLSSENLCVLIIGVRCVFQAFHCFIYCSCVCLYALPVCGEHIRDVNPPQKLQLFSPENFTDMWCASCRQFGC